MTAVPNAGVLGPVLNVGQTAFKAGIEQVVSVLKELRGGSGFTTATISGGTFSIVKDRCNFTVDGEGSVADVLATIGAGTTTLRDGQRIFLKSAGPDITLDHNVGGAKQIYTRTGSDYVLRGTTEIVTLEYRTATDAWHQTEIDWTAAFLLLLGAQPLATLTPSSNVVTPASALIAIDSGAAVDVNQIARTNFPADGPLLLVGGANGTHARTLKHNVGTNGKLLHTDSADIVLDSANKWVLYRSVSTTGPLVQFWQEITRFGFTTSGGGVWTTSAQSGNFAITSIVNKTRYLVTASSDVAIDIQAASPEDGTTELEVIRVSGTGKISLSFSSFAAAASNKVKAPDGDFDPYEMPAGTINRLNLLAITGGWSV